MKDSFLTVRYRNGYIHTTYNHTTSKCEIMATYGYVTKPCNTVIGAKRWITKQEEGSK